MSRSTQDAAAPPIKIMFVCLGNICRSPLAEGAFRRAVEAAGLQDRFEIRSSGTGDWHIGDGADERMIKTAEAHGLSLAAHRGSQFSADDLQYHDHILVMDRNNLHDVLFLDQGDRAGHKVKLFREFDPMPEHFQVPDPYYGGKDGFEAVFEIVERTSAALLRHLIAHYHLERSSTASASEEPTDR